MVYTVYMLFLHLNTSLFEILVVCPMDRNETKPYYYCSITVFLTRGRATRTFALFIPTEYFLLISLLNDFKNFALHHSQVLPTALLDDGIWIHHHAAKNLDGAFKLSMPKHSI